MGKRGKWLWYLMGVAVVIINMSTMAYGQVAWEYSVSGSGTALWSLDSDHGFTPSEWALAGQREIIVNLPGGNSVTGTLYIMNDASNLYLGVKFDHNNIPISAAKLIFLFDDNNDGEFDAGEDAISYSDALFNSGIGCAGTSDCGPQDSYLVPVGNLPGQFIMANDTVNGGINNVYGMIVNLTGNTTWIALSKPLMGDSHDFSKQPWEFLKTRMILEIYDDQGNRIESLYPPFPSSILQTITITAPPIVLCNDDFQGDTPDSPPNSSPSGPPSNDSLFVNLRNFYPECSSSPNIAVVKSGAEFYNYLELTKNCPNQVAGVTASCQVDTSLGPFNTGTYIVSMDVLAPTNTLYYLIYLHAINPAAQPFMVYSNVNQTGTYWIYDGNGISDTEKSSSNIEPHYFKAIVYRDNKTFDFYIDGAQVRQGAPYLGGGDISALGFELNPTTVPAMINIDNMRIAKLATPPAEPDTDGDGIPDTVDNCPAYPNPNQSDIDGDGIGDLCDNCKMHPNPGQEDSGISTSNPPFAGAGNGIGDACDPLTTPSGTNGTAVLIDPDAVKPADAPNFVRACFKFEPPVLPSPVCDGYQPQFFPPDPYNTVLEVTKADGTVIESPICILGTSYNIPFGLVTNTIPPPAGGYCVDIDISKYFPADVLGLTPGEVLYFNVRAIYTNTIQSVGPNACPSIWEGTVITDPVQLPIGNAIKVPIDIKPGSPPPKSINLGSNGTIPVAILTIPPAGYVPPNQGGTQACTSPEFDATQVDPCSVVLEHSKVKIKGKGTPMYSITDVNGDGCPDMLVHVNTFGLALTPSATKAVLTGNLKKGAGTCPNGPNKDLKGSDVGSFFAGSNDIKVVP